MLSRSALASIVLRRSSFQETSVLSPDKYNAVVIGGYGFFGQRIAAGLAATPSIRVLIGERNPVHAWAAAAELGLPAGDAIALDAYASHRDSQPYAACSVTAASRSGVGRRSSGPA